MTPLVSANLQTLLGMVWIRVSDPRSLGSCCIKGTAVVPFNWCVACESIWFLRLLSHRGGEKLQLEIHLFTQAI